MEMRTPVSPHSGPHLEVVQTHGIGPLSIPVRNGVNRAGLQLHPYEGLLGGPLGTWILSVPTIP